MEEEEEIAVAKKKSEAPPPRRKPKKIVIPRRAPSVIVPGRPIIFPSADRSTCAECPCYPKEDPYVKPKKLIACLKSPPTLYELAAAVVDTLRFPEAFNWSVEEVADWMEDTVGLPQYRECILNNHINGLRLLMLEDPSHLPEINIHDFYHIKRITKQVRAEFGTDFVRFARSVGLPPRKPLTHCTWFNSRTGPTWGIRQNWSRCDVLRWMKIILPEPVYLDHWDLVWYHKPDFPKLMFARVKKQKSDVHIPHYKKMEEVCKEYQIPRKFRFQTGIPESAQMIWMEHRPGSPMKKIKEKKPKKKKEPTKKKKVTVPKETRLVPKRISLTGLKGKDLVLARRKMPVPKFLT
ncbi:uncharacterized protein LOC114356384 [Ostrinia furnacalis]|uniref:uncharacterized protein LOC114356384 n=1 Tax=Ostrinia furnacalis TaxID=93504 RepID=UPI00103BCF29|nr:uncharacterized protein LOC114356384 [Ostrinia furnacalis]